MQNTLVNIIIAITTSATENNIVTVLSENANASHLRSSVFNTYAYFVFAL